MKEKTPPVGTSDRSMDEEGIGRPFPLLKTFLLILLPVILVGAVGLVVTLNNAISASAEKLFADQEIKLVRTMLLADGVLDGPTAPSASILNELRKELSEVEITCLSILDRSGRLIAEIAENTSCSPVILADFDDVTLTTGSVLKEDVVMAGHWTSLGIVSIPQTGARAWIAATRKSVMLETAISRLTGFWTKLFAGVFFAAVLSTGLVIAKAQKSIDGQAAYVRGVHSRLRRFLSVAAVRNAIDDEAEPSRFEAVVMFLDLRDFSSFAETAFPKEVAALIDDFVTRVAGAVSDRQGEIDKIIGDGILAVFRGESAASRAIDAALASLKACAGMVREPGIGLYRGEVIAAALGSGQRADFTILGRTVNLASRLCSLSQALEITVPADFALPDHDTLVEVGREFVRPRHHRQSMEVVRYRMADRTQAFKSRQLSAEDLI